MENYLIHKLDTSSVHTSRRLKANVRVNLSATDEAIAEANRKEMLQRMNIRMAKGARKLTLPF